MLGDGSLMVTGVDLLDKAKAVRGRRRTVAQCVLVFLHSGQLTCFECVARVSERASSSMGPRAYGSDQ
jgi:hypothetical protein